MKITGTGQSPTPEVTGTESGSPVGKVDSGGTVVEGPSFAEKLAGTGRAEGAHAGGAVAPGPAHVSAVSGLGEIAADMRAGKLSVQAAIDRVIDKVVAQQVGPHASPAIRQQVRDALASAMEDDPLLAGKLKELGS